MRKLNLLRLVLAVIAMVIAAGRSNPVFASEEIFGFSSEAGSSAESYLGVDTRDVTPDRLNTLQLKEEHGVEITMVDQDAPAGKAGLKEHDVILNVNGTAVESVEQLRRMIHEIPAGRLISIGLSRNGQAMTLKAQLAARQKGFAMAWPQGNDYKVNMPPIPAIPAIPPVPPMPEMDIPVSIVVVHSSTRSGLMVENLTPQLGDFFGVKDGQGILVRSVEKGSRAERAGFHAGDVIVRINGEKINDSGDFSHAINFKKQNPATVTVIREKKQVNIKLSLPDHGPAGENQHETLNTPLGDARMEEDIVRAQSEIAKLQPEIERAVKMRTADIQRLKPEIEVATKAARDQLQKQMKDLQRQLNDQGQTIRRSIQKAFSSQADI